VGTKNSAAAIIAPKKTFRAPKKTFRSRSFSTATQFCANYDSYASIGLSELIAASLPNFPREYVFSRHRRQL